MKRAIIEGVAKGVIDLSKYLAAGLSAKQKFGVFSLIAVLGITYICTKEVVS